MENIATNKRNLMNPDELLKLDNNKEIVIVRGRKPFINILKQVRWKI